MAGTPPPSTNPDSVDRRPSPLRAVARDLWIRVKHRPMRNLSIIGMMILAVILLGYGSQYLTSSRLPKHNTGLMLTQSLEALKAGRITEARNIAADLRLHNDIPVKDRGIPPYVLGQAMYQDAMQDHQPRERKALYLLAARYFDESRQAGMPPGLEGRGLYYLGDALHKCGRYAEAIPALITALDKSPDKARELCQLLTDCYLKDKTPNLQKAAEYNQRYLSNKSLPREERDRAILTQARILFDLGRWAECQQTIDSLPADSPVHGYALLISGRLLLREGDALNSDPATQGDAERQSAVAAKYGAAMQLLQTAAASGDRTSEFQRQAQYLLGLVYRRVGDSIAAEQQFSRTRRTHFETPEGIAASLEEAELQHLLGNDQEALESYRRTLRQAADAKSFGAPWLTADEIRRRVEQTFNVYREEERFAQAVDLINSLAALFPDARTIELQARLHEAWAKYLLRSASPNGGAADTKVLTQARLEHRHAGHLFAQLARLRFATREYGTDLWNSGENYLNGQDYDSAVRMYQRFLQNQSRSGRPAALVRMGESLLALNRTDEALVSLNECIESFPKDPFVYGARLIAAGANLELGQIDRAKELLVTNLENDSLTPQSREWRESLYLLGRILFRQGVHYETQSRLTGVDSKIASERQNGLKQLALAQKAFQDCSRRLSEALQREPDAPQALEARYMLAQAHLQSAKLPKKELGLVNIETTRVIVRSEMRRELTYATAAFEDLKARLIDKQENQEKTGLTLVEQLMLRNCYFGIADALFDLEQYKEAIEAYSSATNAYQHEPESLEAYVQIANCHRKLNQPVESRRTIDLAKTVLLTRIRPDADFLATTRYDRKEWVELLDLLSNL